MIYFTSDQHFCHEKIIKLADRPFKSAEEMNETMVSNWNSTVKPNDTVWHLGDFGRKPQEEILKIRRRLNGHIHFVRGNHDKGNVLHTFESLQDYKVLKVDGRVFVLFHYPIFEWYGYFRNSIHLYGHTHNNPKNACLEQIRPNCHDVSVDANNFYPVSLDFLVKNYIIVNTGKEKGENKRDEN